MNGIQFTTKSNFDFRSFFGGIEACFNRLETNSAQDLGSKIIIVSVRKLLVAKAFNFF